MIAVQMPLSRLPDVFGGQHHFIKAEAVQFTMKNGAVEYAKPAPKTPSGLPAIPVLRPGVNDHLFVDTKLVPVKGVLVPEADLAVATGPLRFGVAMDILSISTHDALVETGLQDYTDSLGAEISLKNIYVNIADNVFMVNVENHALNAASFDMATNPGANYQDMVVNYNNILTIDCNTPLVSITNEKTSLVEQLLSGGTLKICVNVMGGVNRQFGTTELVARHVAGVDVKVVTPEALEASEQLSHYLSQATIVFEGYDLNVTRFNPNRRPR